MNTTRRDEVVLHVPANAGYVALLRTVVGGCAGHRNFTLDQIDDLRMAVDEAAGQLLKHVVGDGVELAVAEGDHALEVRVSAATSADGVVIDRESFTWTILQVLADELDVRTEGSRTIVTLRALPEVGREDQGRGTA
jgi:serine/threonine-protein kinase RsbW